MSHEVHVKFAGKIVMVGFGSIGQGVLPLILRHIGTSAERITIVTADEAGRSEAAKYGVKFVNGALTRENYRARLEPLLGPGDFLLNLSVDVSSIALVKLARERGALYLDTCIEPWAGGYFDANASVEKRSNYSMRLDALAMRDGKSAPTAVLTHGANPGLVSHFVKKALLDIAADSGVETATPKSRDEWARLAQRVGVKVIHIAERDTQVSKSPKKLNEFVNTWSVDGFVAEMKGSEMHPHAMSGLQVEVGPGGVVGVHVLGSHEPARLVGSHGEQTDPGGSQALTDDLK